jgi:chemotaxis protein methyltransferase CheR
MESIDITPEEFEKIRKFIKTRVGISLSDQKAVMVKGRLHKRLLELGMRSFEEYYRYLTSEDGAGELSNFINAISTNVTSFFRSPQHWQYLKENMHDIFYAKRNKKLRIWSAACSSGEEPYSIMMFLKEHLHDFREWDIKVLATDISQKALSKAVSGVYPKKDIEQMSSWLVGKYFEKQTNGYDDVFSVCEDIKSNIVFRSFNLVTEDFSIFKNQFDIVFCRNVMIYFDAPTRKTLISKFRKLLPKEGLFIIGDSEAITENKAEFSFIKSSIYRPI